MSDVFLNISAPDPSEVKSLTAELEKLPPELLFALTLKCMALGFRSLGLTKPKRKKPGRKC